MKTILVDAGGTLLLKPEGINQELLALLETYPNPKIILSNTTDEELDSFHIREFPYPIFSLAHNPDKTDPQYFIKLLAHYGLEAQDVVYFDHVPEAVKSAESLGIISYYYNSIEKDLIALKVFLDQNSLG